MQNSELFRRGVVLPLDDQAEQGLRCNDVDPTTHVQFLRIDSDTIFESLWSSGLFHQINQRCGTLIDDYEEDFVAAPDLQKLVAAVAMVANNINGGSDDEKAFLLDLHAISLKALSLQRPILFIL